MPRIWHPFRAAGRFVLIVLGGGGSCLIAERLAPGEPLSPTTPVRVHPHPLHVMLNVAYEFSGIRFALKASTHTKMSRIEVVRDPGLMSRVMPIYPPAEPDPELTQEQIQIIVAQIDKEIIGWGEMLAAAHETNRGENAGWPSGLCRYVLPHKERATEMVSLIKATAIMAYDKFVDDDRKSLSVSIFPSNRPHAIQGSNEERWVAFVNLQGGRTPEPMKEWIEDTLRKAVCARWPEGWYEVAGPATTSRLGVMRQMRKTSHEVRGPLSNHQRIAAREVLAQTAR